MKILIVTVLCALYALLNSAGAATIKKELAQVTMSGVQDYFFFLFRWKVIMALGFVFLSMMVMFGALKLAEFSLVNPIATGINFTLAVIIGAVFFREKVSPAQFVGLAVILSGILILSFSSPSGKSVPSQETSSETEETVTSTPNTIDA